MRLHEHEQFAALITATAAETDLSEQFVEKDYWITAILQVVATTLPERAMFKGGTSLSKGWNLLHRFSEDIDLEFVEDQSKTIGGLGRMDTMRYASRYPSLTGFPATVRLEPGVQSGTHPTATLPITSLVGDMLQARGVIEQLGVTGLAPFEMTLLHFRRTFVEKLFAIHGKVERLKTDGHPLGRDARHYADLFVLAGQPEVLEMIGSDEYILICTDYDRTSRSYSPKTYRPPKDLRFGDSDALFPSDALRTLIEPDYEAECARLFYRPHPPFREVLDRFKQIRDQL